MEVDNITHKTTPKRTGCVAIDINWNARSQLLHDDSLTIKYKTCFWDFYQSSGCVQQKYSMYIWAPSVIMKWITHITKNLKPTTYTHDLRKQLKSYKTWVKTVSKSAWIVLLSMKRDTLYSKKICLQQKLLQINTSAHSTDHLQLPRWVLFFCILGITWHLQSIKSVVQQCFKAYNFIIPPNSQSKNHW